MGDGLALAVMACVGLTLYFLPTVVASARGHHQRNAIFVLNLFLGWTGLVWVIALAMAVSAKRTVTGA